MTALLYRFDKLLVSLKTQAQQFDNQNQATLSQAFDKQLFVHTHSKLSGYVSDSQITLQKLKKSNQDNQIAQSTHFAEVLENQINAIVMILKRHQSQNVAMEASSFYDQLNQLKVWEQRLIQMVHQRAHELDHSVNKASAEQQLLLTEQRLRRCQHAITQVHKQLPNLEHNHD